MTSKEALEKLNNLIWREKHINSERNKTINECINTIQQDLERLEVLEKENKSIRFNNIQVCNRNKKYIKCIQEILEYAKYELDSIEVVDKIECILNEVLGEWH